VTHAGSITAGANEVMEVIQVMEVMQARGQNPSAPFITYITTSPSSPALPYEAIFQLPSVARQARPLDVFDLPSRQALMEKRRQSFVSPALAASGVKT
jgi:hypothetical protein